METKRRSALRLTDIPDPSERLNKFLPSGSNSQMKHCKGEFVFVWRVQPCLRLQLTANRGPDPVEHRVEPETSQRPPNRCFI